MSTMKPYGCEFIQVLWAWNKDLVVVFNSFFFCLSFHGRYRSVPCLIGYPYRFWASVWSKFLTSLRLSSICKKSRCFAPRTIFLAMPDQIEPNRLFLAISWNFRRFSSWQYLIKKSTLLVWILEWQ